MIHLSDTDFENQFADCTLDPNLFTHLGHLRLAYVHLKKYGSTQAIKNLCTQIAQYDRTFGDGTKYHVTVTIAAVAVIDHFIRKSVSQTFSEFIGEFPRLETHFKEILARHYSFDIFKNAGAKADFIKPDLLPFDKEYQRM